MLHDVLQLPDVLSGDTWFRPVAIRGSGVAYATKDGSVYCVPSARGGSPGICSYVDLLAGEWEQVAPADVLGER